MRVHMTCVITCRTSKKLFPYSIRSKFTINCAKDVLIPFTSPLMLMQSRNFATEFFPLLLFINTTITKNENRMRECLFFFNHRHAYVRAPMQACHQTLKLETVGNNRRCWSTVSSCLESCRFFRRGTDRNVASTIFRPFGPTVVSYRLCEEVKGESV